MAKALKLSHFSYYNCTLSFCQQYKVNKLDTNPMINQEKNGFEIYRYPSFLKNLILAFYNQIHFNVISIILQEQVFL